MGSFESITAQIGAILGTEVIDIHKKGVLIFCADNGIVEEGVTQSGQEVTLAVAKSMARKGSSVCRMAQSIGAETIPVDIGINSEESIPGVLDRKVRPGTRNFLKGPTMTEEETVRAIVTGIELVRECKEKDTVSLPPGNGNRQHDYQQCGDSSSFAVRSRGSHRQRCGTYGPGTDS